MTDGGSKRRFGRLPALALTGETRAFGPWMGWMLAALVAFAIGIRLFGLSAEGFADDEVHKWYAANRYLHGDFVGDDIEHPMLMKSLIAICLLLGRPLGLAPETMVRLPSALFGAASVLLVALLGRRLFGRSAGLIAAGIAAASSTFIGYNRIAKEDTPVTFFLLLMVWCLAEAKAAADDGRGVAQGRWELGTAASLGAMMASKYFLFYGPIPLFGYWLLRHSGTAWRIPFRRWMALLGTSLLVFAALNWVPLLPASWQYLFDYFEERKTVHGALFFMGRIYHNLPSYGFHGTPPWFYAVFAAVKLAPPTVIAAAVGLLLALVLRAPSHRVLLPWIGIFAVGLGWSGSKWGRFFVSVFPALALLAGYAAVEGAAWVRARRPGTPAVATATLLGLLLVGTEAAAALRHAPHERLYINTFGGGDAGVTWFFPHDDYFDAGFREAVAYVAAHAEPGAELSTEIDWPARYYAERFGRPDLVATMMRPEAACLGRTACYVVVQAGRWYFQNEAAVRALAVRTPWHVERIRGADVVKVYRLAPGERPFP